MDRGNNSGQIVSQGKVDLNRCMECCRRGDCLLSQMTDREAVDFARLVHRSRLLSQDQHLFLEGGSAHWLHIVRSGSFKSYITYQSGELQLTGFHFPGQVLGLDGIDLHKHRCSMQALEASSVCSLPFDALESFSNRTRGRLYRQLIGAMGGMLKIEDKQLFVLAKLHAEQKLASFLLDIANRMHCAGGSRTEFNLSMPRHDIANYLGLAGETVSRLLKRFETDGLIRVRRRNIRLLEVPGLHDVVNGELRFSSLREIA